MTRPSKPYAQLEPEVVQKTEAEPLQVPSEGELEVQPFVVSTASAQAQPPTANKRFFLFSNRSHLPTAADSAMLAPLPTILGVKPEPWLTASLKPTTKVQAPQQAQVSQRLEQSGPTEEELQKRATYWRRQREVLRETKNADANMTTREGNGNIRNSRPGGSSDAGRQLALELSYPVDTSKKVTPLNVTAIRQALTCQLRGTLETHMQ